MQTFRLGIDLGGTNIALGIVDAQGNITARAEAKTCLPRPETELEQSIADLCRSAAAQAGVDFAQIEYVGVGTPGSVNGKTGMVDFNANFGYRNWPLAQRLEKLLQKKVYIENDANAAAYGEYRAGAAAGAQSMVMVTLGTGIGGGVVLDGKIYGGSNGFAAEIGHMVICHGGRECACGRHGCWEKYASASALTQAAQQAMQNSPDTLLWQLAQGNLQNANAKIVFDAMRAGDKTAAQLVEKYESYLACGLVNIVDIFQPQIICIGGGISKEGEALLRPVRALVDAEDYARGSARRVTITTAKLHNDAGIIGAALLGEQYL